MTIPLDEQQAARERVAFRRLLAEHGVPRTVTNEIADVEELRRLWRTVAGFKIPDETEDEKAAEALARALCEDAGLDPDGETFGGFPHYFERIDAAKDLLHTLRGAAVRRALVALNP